MQNAKEVAELYFELSNKSDFKGIAELLTDSTTYSSQNTGLYLGTDEILKMQKQFHGEFSSLEWKVNSAKEVKPGIVLFDYSFVAELPNGGTTQAAGLEYVIVKNGKILHIEVRNK